MAAPAVISRHRELLEVGSEGKRDRAGHRTLPWHAVRRPVQGRRKRSSGRERSFEQVDLVQAEQLCEEAPFEPSDVSPAIHEEPLRRAVRARRPAIAAFEEFRHVSGGHVTGEEAHGPGVDGGRAVGRGAACSPADPGWVRTARRKWHSSMVRSTVAQFTDVGTDGVDVIGRQPERVPVDASPVLPQSRSENPAWTASAA